ncbi:MAG: hypothetical protein RAP03_04700, partial [Candidatus Electryonea clarkiae]|nr:hypothetical protein [Candidatus Electryonea clarkiae]
MKKTENIAKLWIGTVLPEGVIDADVYRKYYNQQAKYDDKYLGTDGIYKHDAPTSPEYPNSQSTGIAIRPFTRISEILDASFEDESITEEGSIVPSQELLWELIASEKNIDGMIADKTLFCIYSISYNEKLFFLKPVLVKIV